MQFFKTIRDDLAALWHKIEGTEQRLVPEVEAQIKKELFAVVQKLVDYVESRLPEIEAAAVAAVAAEVPGAGAVVAAAGLAAEAATKALLDEVKQKVDAEEPTR